MHHALDRLSVKIQERFELGMGHCTAGLLMKAELSREEIVCFTYTNMGGGGEKEGVPAACRVTRPTPATQQGRARGPRAPRGGGEGQRASRWV